MVACGGEEAAPTGVELPEGFEATVVVDGLDGPTQFTVTDEGDLIVAILNGGENDALGQIVRIDADDPDDRTVLVDGLDKPTGVAVFDGDLWVMERDRLSRGPLDGGLLEPFVRDLPNNGRSEGTLTVTTDGRLLYDTSGSKRGAAVTEGSGRLWETDGTTITELASGFKHAYAHVADAAGRLWTTEMTDGRFDGTPGADEVVRVVAGADHGWPYCVGDNRPVAEYGGTAARCAGVPPSLTTFDPGATPTGIAVAPWDADILIVALWNEGRIVAVPIPDDGEPAPSATFASGLVGPQHLQTDGDRLLLSEFGTGRIIEITATG